MKKWSEGKLKGILQYTDEPLVSWDLRGNPHSSILDSELTYIVEKEGNKGDFVKLMAWYDNEYGYSCRIVDLLKYVGNKL
jgi:glyceraldehyde 3-phosphate dehydrogenase